MDVVHTDRSYLYPQYARWHKFLAELATGRWKRLQSDGALRQGDRYTLWGALHEYAGGQWQRTSTHNYYAKPDPRAALDTYVLDGGLPVAREVDLYELAMHTAGLPAALEARVLRHVERLQERVGKKMPWVKFENWTSFDWAVIVWAMEVHLGHMTDESYTEWKARQ